MRRFDNLKMTLFDSTKASFKLAVEAQFTRGNKDQGYRDLVYVTDKFTGILNPNIYITLSYKDENVNPVYTSYPQLFRLREAMNKMKDMIKDNAAFLDVEGEISVKQEYSEPIVLANIGKNNNWISMKPAVIQLDENGISKSSPAVVIELSTANRMASALTVDEFLTVCTIINDIDLSVIQCMMSLAFLDTERAYMNGYQQAQIPVYPQQPYMNQQSNMPGNMGYARSNNQYQQQNPGYFAQQPRVQQPRYNNQTTFTPRAPREVVQQPIQPKVQQQNTNSSRDANAPIMNFAAVESTPISEITYDDTNSLDDIFGNN